MATLGAIADIVFRHGYEDAGFTTGMRQASEAAQATAAAGDRVAVSAQRIAQETGKAAGAWAGANRAAEDNVRLAAATERANRQLEQQLAALRRQAEQDPAIAARQVDAERE